MYSDDDTGCSTPSRRYELLLIHRNLVIATRSAAKSCQFHAPSSRKPRHSHRGLPPAAVGVAFAFHKPESDTIPVLQTSSWQVPDSRSRPL
jgi:hypothetical protein